MHHDVVAHMVLAAANLAQGTLTPERMGRCASSTHFRIARLAWAIGNGYICRIKKRRKDVYSSYCQLRPC